MTPLYLWDDARARRFEPFTLTRPVGELRAGAELIRRRWEQRLGMVASGFVSGAPLRDFEEAGAPPAADAVPAGSVVANSRCVVSLAADPAGAAAGDAAGDGAPGPARWLCDGRLAAVRLARAVSAAELMATDALESLGDAIAEGASTEVPGRWLEQLWELLGTLAVQLTEDVAALGATLTCDPPPAGVTVLGAHPVFLERGATVEPLVLLDASAGPILVRRGATITALTRLAGPAMIGEASSVLGGRLHTVSIGEHCKVHGEMSTTIFLAYANKAHDGFVGHSYVGRWVNVGAGTITSNLKNTYGTVHLWTPEGMCDTGLQFLGTMFGDHVKTGIGTRLTTGCVLGAAANVFGEHMPPKVVPPFAWGDGAPYALFELPRFFTQCERMMARRQVMLGERGRRQLTAAWDAAALLHGRVVGP